MMLPCLKAQAQVFCHKMKYVFFVFFLACNVSSVKIQKFVAPFHKVNYKNLEGQFCKDFRPTRTLECPVFGILVNGKNSHDFNQACRNINMEFGCNDSSKYLDVDGACRKCPAGYNLKENQGRIWCEDTSGHITNNDTQNPFDCNEKGKITRQVLDAYRPCYEANRLSVDVRKYYKGDNLNDELTYHYCAERYGISNTKTEIHQGGTEIVYDFPLIRDASKDTAFGYLSCPIEPPKTYSYFEKAWIAFHLFIYTVIGTLIIFVIYKYNAEYEFKKHLKEAKLVENIELQTDFQNNSSMGKNSPTTKSSMEDDGEQRGYKDCLLGTIGFYMVIAMTLFLLFFLIFMIFDLYGLYYGTLCQNQDVYDTCKKAQNENRFYSWRTGIECASGCLFSMELSKGYYITWPFTPHKGGGKRQQLFFLIMWGITIIWVLFVKITSNHLRYFFRIRCPLREGQRVQVVRQEEPEVKVWMSEQNAVMKFVLFADSVKEKLLGKPTTVEDCKVFENLEGRRFIDSRCRRMIWCDRSRNYTVMPIDIGSTHREISEHGNEGLTSAEAKRRLDLVGENAIRPKVQTFFEAAFEEFFAYFYFYQFGCLYVWFNFMYWPMGCIILITILLSGIMKVVTKRRAQKRLRTVADIRGVMIVYRDKKWQHQGTENLVPGDVVAVIPNSVVCCDLVLIDGRCVVDESSLTGEPTPVPKIPVSNKDDIPFSQTDSESMKFAVLAGTYVQSVSGSSMEDHAWAVVVSTGASTQKGALIRSILLPKKLTFLFDEHWKAVFIILFIWALITGLFTVIQYGGLLEGYYYAVFNISQVISPIIPAMFVAVEVKACSRLKNIGIYCTNLHRVMVAAKVKTFCFDKTGTLTKTGLDFYGIQLFSDEGDISEFKTTADSDLPDRVALLLGSCHELDWREQVEREYSETVIRNSNSIGLKRWKRKFNPKYLFRRNKKIDDFSSINPSSHERVVGGGQPHDTDLVEITDTGEQEIVGNEVDKEMYLSSGFSVLTSGQQPILNCKERGIELQILKRFEFNRTRMTMCSIVRDLQTSEVLLFCKGSYEALYQSCRSTVSKNDYDDITGKLAKEGFYVLAIAYRLLDIDVDVSNLSRDDAERDMTLCGLLLFRNDIKPDSQDAIETLKAAGVNSVMITGDNALTAAKIAKDSSLSCAEKILLGDINDNTGELIWKDIKNNIIENDLLGKLSFMKKGIIELAVTGKAFDKLQMMPPPDMVDSMDQHCLEDKKLGGKKTSIFEITNDNKNSRTTSSFNDNKNDNPNSNPTNTSPTNTSLMAFLLPYTRIFARMKPDQKVQAVLLEMRLAITGMCGDGANDAAALRTAHCGIALTTGESCEASMVAPFSTKHGSLFSIVEVLRYGRCCMASAVGAYKQLILYGEIMTMLTIISNAFGILAAEPFWLTWDSIINVGMTWAVIQSRPASRLSSTRPTARLLGTETVISVTIQIFIAWFFQCMAVVLLFHQSWFRCKEFDANLIDAGKWWLKGDNYEASVLALVCISQFILAGPSFAFGFDYRRGWIFNIYLVAFAVGGLIFVTILLFTNANALTCLYRVNCGDWYLLKHWSENNLLGKVQKYFSTPLGCPCSEQIIIDPKCEAEYIDCKESSIFNQTYHHNIMPNEFKWKLYLLILTNITVALLVERLGIVGPLRKYFRKRYRKKQCLTENGHFHDDDFEHRPLDTERRHSIELQDI